MLCKPDKNDYHWWRDNKVQLWSHKPGSTDVTNVDASGKKIKNPFRIESFFVN